MIILALGCAALAQANVPPSPPDPCIRAQEGEACKPRGPAGTCTWITPEARSNMELHDEPRCEKRGALGYRCLMCVSAMFLGDDATLRKRAAALIAAGEVDNGELLVQYIHNLADSRCDADLGALWYSLARAGEATRRSSVEYQYAWAIRCAPRNYDAYVRQARSGARLWPQAYGYNPFDALLGLSRAMLRYDAPAAEWTAMARMLEADPELETLRKDARFAMIRERFALGARLAVKPASPFYCKPEAKEWLRVSPNDVRDGKYDKSCLPASGAAHCPGFFLTMRGEPPRGAAECKVK